MNIHKNPLFHSHSQRFRDEHPADLPALPFDEIRFIAKGCYSGSQLALKGALVAGFPVEAAKQRTAMVGQGLKVDCLRQSLDKPGLTGPGQTMDDNELRPKILQSIQDIPAVFFIPALQLTGCKPGLGQEVNHGQ